VFNHWFQCGNVSVTPPLTITNENPTNNSNIPYTHPTIYFTINSLTGLQMNYTISWSTSLNETLATATGQVNGTYYHLFTNASTIGTTYTWCINLTDTDNNWLNHTYSFTTRREMGYLGGSGSTQRNSLWILGIIGILGLACFFIFFIYKRRKN